MRRVRHLFYSFIVIMAFSCSADGFFQNTGDEQQDAGLEILAKDTLFGPGDIIALNITQKEDDVKYVLKISLYSALDELISEELIEDLDEYNNAPDVEVPDIEDGFYYFNFELTKDDNLVSKIRKNFLIYENNPSIVDLSSYPPVIYPGAGGLINATIKPADSNPYLRWSMGGQIVGEGYLVDGLDSIEWISPGLEGFYSVSLELYPSEIPENFPADISGNSISETQLFVSQKQEPGIDEIEGKESSYLTLFHFRGEYRDYRHELKEAVRIGSPKLALERNLFGFSFSGGDGFSTNYSAVPFAETGTKPFTMMLQGYIPQIDPGSNIFGTGTDTASFNVICDEEGFLVSKIEVNGVAAESKVELIFRDIYSMALSVIPLEKELIFRWFINGDQVAQEKLLFEVEKANITKAGSWTLIGGDNGFAGLIDEFAVYVKDESGMANVRSDIFEREMEELYDEELLFADGFDGISFSAGYSEESTAKLEDGVLVINPDEFIDIKDLQIDEATRLITILFENLSVEKDSAEIIIKSGENKAGLVLNYAEGTIGVKENFIAAANFEEEGIKLEIINGELNLTDDETSIPIIALENNKFDLLLQNAGEKAVKIDKLLIIRENKAIITNQNAAEIFLFV